MPKLRILLADDHETVREGLKSILNAQTDMQVVAEAVDGQAAVDNAAVLHPDIVILDISMPRLNGLRAAETIKRANPHAKVLMLTRHGDVGYLQPMLRAGASGYVLKQSRAADVLQAIRAVARGDTYVDRSLAERLDNRTDGASPPALVRIPRSALTNREEEVLRYVAWGYSNKEIAARLELSVKTVETHKANAAQKLGLVSRIEIVRYALLAGWLRDN